MEIRVSELERVEITAKGKLVLCCKKCPVDADLNVTVFATNNMNSLIGVAADTEPKNVIPNCYSVYECDTGYVSTTVHVKDCLVVVADNPNTILRVVIEGPPGAISKLLPGKAKVARKTARLEDVAKQVEENLEYFTSLIEAAKYKTIRVPEGMYDEEDDEFTVKSEETVLVLVPSRGRVCTAIVGDRIVAGPGVYMVGKVRVNPLDCRAFVRSSDGKIPSSDVARYLNESLKWAKCVREGAVGREIASILRNPRASIPLIAALGAPVVIPLLLSGGRRHE